jgi:hypothetical protein
MGAAAAIVAQQLKKRCYMTTDSIKKKIIAIGDKDNQARDAERNRTRPRKVELKFSHWVLVSESETYLESVPLCTSRNMATAKAD